MFEEIQLVAPASSVKREENLYLLSLTQSPVAGPKILFSFNGNQNAPFSYVFEEVIFAGCSMPNTSLRASHD